MNSDNMHLPALVLTLGISLLCVDAARASGGLNCDVAGVQFNLPTPGTPLEANKAVTPQIQVQCSPASPQPGLKLPAARSTYPTNRAAGQVTWGTDHHHTSGPARGGVLTHRSQATTLGTNDHSGR